MIHDLGDAQRGNRAEEYRGRRTAPGVLERSNRWRTAIGHPGSDNNVSVRVDSDRSGIPHGSWSQAATGGARISPVQRIIVGGARSDTQDNGGAIGHHSRSLTEGGWWQEEAVDPKVATVDPFLHVGDDIGISGIALVIDIPSTRGA